jgi:hypothetical protein
MEPSALTLEELTRFGIEPKDDGIHPHDPSVEWWNESWFWDWFDDDARLAGHCRIGLHPVQRRLWLWFFLYRDGEWIALEAPRLSLEALGLPRLAFESHGLRFEWLVEEPLRSGRLTVEGFGRVVSGPRAGLVLATGAELEVRATGAAHSIGRHAATGHSSEGYDAARFEQPIDVSGRLRFGDESLRFRGRGERDHSWGPRLWNLEWIFLAVSSRDLRLQCAEARVPDAGRFAVGYLHTGTTASVFEVDFDLCFDDDSLAEPVAGRFTARAQDGTTVGGRIEVISAAEIDITHTLVPPERSIYRRALIRVARDGEAEPLLGWMEFNYFRKRG